MCGALPLGEFSTESVSVSYVNACGLRGFRLNYVKVLIHFGNKGVAY